MAKIKTIGIIGAGATGLAAAHHLAKAGYEVTILERNDELGGLAASIDVGGTRLERYYHHLFATDTVFISLAKELGLGDKLIFKTLPTGILYNGKPHDFSTPAQMLSFSPIPFLDRVRFGFVSAFLKAFPKHEPFQSKNMLKWSNRYYGKATTRVIWEPLLRAKFGKHADSISMAWLWARVHLRTFRLGYMLGGFDQMYVALADAVKERKGKILFSQKIKHIRQSSKTKPVEVEMEDGTKLKFDRLITTTPQPAFAAAIGAEPNDKLWQNRYLGATCFIMELSESFIPHYWLNINDEGYPFLVAVEQTRFIGPENYGGNHVIYIGNYLERDDWRFTTDPEELLEKYIPYMQKINPSFKKSWIKKWQFSRAPFGQPIVTPEYHTHIPSHTTPLPGVYLATMSQVYPQDRGQNYAFKMGIKVADMVKDSLS